MIPNMKFPFSSLPTFLSYDYRRLLKCADTSRHDLFVHLWKDRSNPVGVLENPLIAFGKDMNYEDSQARNFHWDCNVEPGSVM